MESEVILRKRNNSITYLRENKNVDKNIKSQIDNNQNNKENKIHKYLSFEKYEKIKEPNKNININKIDKDIPKESDPILNNEKNNKVAVSKVKKVGRNNNIISMEESQSSEECSDYNFNSISNRELLIINENMKSLFLNSANSIKKMKLYQNHFCLMIKIHPKNQHKKQLIMN